MTRASMLAIGCLRPYSMTEHVQTAAWIAGSSPAMTPNGLAQPHNALMLVPGGEIDDGRQNGADDHPQELIPVEERHAEERWLGSVVEGRPQHGDELDDE